MRKKSTKPLRVVSETELLAPCGMYCGLCTSSLSKKYNIPRRRGIISYCEGCRPRDKQCSFVKKKCDLLLNHNIEYCYKCNDFPCKVLEKIEYSYNTKFNYSYSFIRAQKEIKEHGPSFVIDRLKKEFGCKKCGEILCIHNGLCYNCDKEQLAVMKNYRNEN